LSHDEMARDEKSPNRFESSTNHALIYRCRWFTN